MTYTVKALDDPVLRDGVPDTTTISAYMGGLVLSYNEKAATLAANRQATFQWINEQSKRTVTEMVNEVMPAHAFLLPANGIHEPPLVFKGPHKKASNSARSQTHTVYLIGS